MKHILFLLIIVPFMAYSKEDLNDKELIKLLEKLDMSKEALASIPFADTGDENELSDEEKESLSL